LERHTPAHALAQGKIARRHSEHSAKGSGQMRSVGESCAMSGGSDTGAIYQVAGCPLQPEPENIRPERNAHRLSENVHETRLRQARYASQGLQRKIIRPSKLLPEVFEYAIYPGMDLHWATPVQQLCSHPPFDPRLSRGLSQGGAPACNLAA